ncbi:hypothetical protein [Cyanobacterium sp. Dongsha4]|uniref:hypothetical protein n=1 Tax=Cyanobacterium sp. DS4 TaxID=2878255 RepID=UPI002E817077|nr:hypothetical protein [Cyanobacterium sp. Dongsha4]WVL00616.1 hypothetical protein Dongsha4_18560 [Cyanobacterium sp. Dongsha4]
MWIDRVKVAKIIGTKAVNVKKTKQIGDDIIIYLWDSPETLSIKIEEYKSFDPKITECSNNESNNLQQKSSETSPKKKIGIILMVIGGIMIISGNNMDTSVSTGDGSRVSNLSLMKEQSNKIEIGGIVLISGILLYSLDR